MDKIDSFKNRLEQSMREAGLTQNELALKSGISKSLINKYLKGVSEAGNHKLLLLAAALNVNPLWLMGYDVEKYKIPESRNINTEKQDLILQIESECKKASIEELKMILRVVKSMVNKQ